MGACLVGKRALLSLDAALVRRIFLGHLRRGLVQRELPFGVQGSRCKVQEYLVHKKRPPH
jgi:hypothetical protein